MGRDPGSGGVSVPCRYAKHIANVLWKPLIIRFKVSFRANVKSTMDCVTCNACIKSIWLDVHWNWLSDKICISFYECWCYTVLKNVVWTHQTIIKLIHTLYAMLDGFIKCNEVIVQEFQTHPIQMKSSMTLIQSNDCNEINVILKIMTAVYMASHQL